MAVNFSGCVRAIPSCSELVLRLPKGVLRGDKTILKAEQVKVPAADVGSEFQDHGEKPHRRHPGESAFSLTIVFFLAMEIAVI
ncbi:MAG: hypothetical protein ACLQVJ_04185 [Syntrophobacteraceae bacterium]